MATANKKSTIIIIPAFADEVGTVLTLGQLITPIWSVTTADGQTFINGLENMPLTDLFVVLTGDDLDTDDAGNVDRLITFEAQYNSATYGNGLYLKEEYNFSVKDLQKVA